MVYIIDPRTVVNFRVNSFRYHRLTLAGHELSSSDLRVIDVAHKYGYDTPESFIKAFARFHGITPKTAQEPGAKPKSFCRLSIKILLEDGDVMNRKIEKKSKLSLSIAGSDSYYQFSFCLD